MYQDFSTRHDWPVKNTIVDLPIRSKENSKRISGNSLSLLKAMNKGVAAASQTLLTRAQLFEGRLALNPGFFFWRSKAFSRIIFSVIFRASIFQLVDKKN